MFQKVGEDVIFLLILADSKFLICSSISPFAIHPKPMQEAIQPVQAHPEQAPSYHGHRLSFSPHSKDFNILEQFL